ncbi:MAG: phosphotransferase [Candidatus Dojkabacteria bacterium]|nr:phosphotransferase [Candidatus Dojkabacteria bacterium]
MKKLIKDVIKKNYNIDVEKVVRLEGGFRNDCFRIETRAQKYVFIIYKREKCVKTCIQNAHLVAGLLQKKGFSTRVLVKTILNDDVFKIRVFKEFHYCALYNYLEGLTIPWEAYTRRHLKSMGKTLSDMHHALQEIPMTKSPVCRQAGNYQLKINNQFQITQLPNWTEITRKEIHEMRKYLEKVEPWIEKKLKVKLSRKKIEQVFKSTLKLSPPEAGPPLAEAILHYDFVRGNILFSNKLDKKLDIYPIVGILDFEKVCIGPVIADVARSLAFLIIDCKYKKEETVKKRFLISGYNRRGKNKLSLKYINSSLMMHLLSFFWLRDFWKFLEHNPYEYLYMNEHYVRTRDRLAAGGLLSAGGQADKPMG